ncbi:hypothetical protein KHQ81_08915 [Mycoplasmatota bacterium]|nr:hypothetical protein KHQ81_08915 [Mycoplasmatota bacterium]
MLETKLILVEGITGTGKSTTAQILRGHIKRCGYEVRLYHEEQANHPIHEWDINNIDEFIDTTLNNWRKFVSKQKESQEVIILETSLLQSTVRILIEMNASDDIIYQYAFDVENIIEELNPVLIYIYKKDVVKSLKEICEERGEEWVKYIASNLEETEYAKKHDVKDFDLFSSIIKKFRTISDYLITQYHMPCISIDVSSVNREEKYNIITKKLNLPPLKRENLINNQYIGKYKNTKLKKECCVVYKEQKFYLQKLIFDEVELIQKEGDFFYIQGESIELEFKRDNEGNVNSFFVHCDFEWEISKTLWEKVI